MPLPVTATVQRFRDLALDRRSWLYVTHAAVPERGSEAPRRRRFLQATPSSASLSCPQAAKAGGAADAAAGGAEPDDNGGPHWYRSQFGSLAAALAASRPGDTILLEPGPGGHPACLDARPLGCPPCFLAGLWGRRHPALAPHAPAAGAAVARPAFV